MTSRQYIIGRKGSFFDRKMTGILKKVIILNAFVFALVLISVYSMLAAFTGGLLIIMYLFANSVRKPAEVFFIIFGIKLTFDALWQVKPLSLPSLGSVGLLELFFVPVLIIALIGPRMERDKVKWPLVLALVYLGWVALAMLVNGRGIDYEILVRQSGLFLGLLLGMKYVRDYDDLNKIVYLVFISTIIPVLASVVQFATMGLDIPIFHCTMSTVRGYRIAGLYYDTGTAGMVNVICILSNAYLINFGLVKKDYRYFHLAMIPLCVLVILAGGTRAVIIVAFLGILVSMVRKPKTALRVAPLLIAVFIVAQPHIDRVIVRNSLEMIEKEEMTQIMERPDYRPMFTGRVGLWQDVWNKFRSGNDLEQLVGSGLSSNAHSTYFYLLLQVGWMGLAFYVVFNLLLLYKIINSKAPFLRKSVAVASLVSLLLIGISMSTVMYTSFQWIVYIVVGGVIAGARSRVRVRKKILVEGEAEGAKEKEETADDMEEEDEEVAALRRDFEKSLAAEIAVRKAVTEFEYRLAEEEDIDQATRERINELEARLQQVVREKEELQARLNETLARMEERKKKESSAGRKAALALAAALLPLAALAAVYYLGTMSRTRVSMPSRDGPVYPADAPKESYDAGLLNAGLQSRPGPVDDPGVDPGMPDNEVVQTAPGGELDKETITPVVDMPAVPEVAAVGLSGKDGRAGGKKKDMVEPVETGLREKRHSSIRRKMPASGSSEEAEFSSVEELDEMPDGPKIIEDGDGAVSVRSDYERAEELIKAGDLRGAEDIYLSIIESDPDNGMAYFVLGDYYMDLGMYGLAEEMYKRASLHP